MVAVRTLVRLAVLAVALMSVTVSRAGEVTSADVRREGDWLVVDLQLADLLDERTRSTVESGLPGSCLLEIELRDERGKYSTTRRLERSLEVDLWEDVVRMIESSHELVFRSLAEADSAWSNWSSLRLAQWSSLPQGRTYHLRIGVHVQPLGAEERERVSRWVSAGDRGDRRDVSIDVGGLMRRFFGSGGDIGEVQVWSGPKFQLDSIGGAP
ncbi:hypothetical protein DRQ53_13495 [bacterium]|nr:MAG: hypothetical protein DRQ53_13495 [bacterium]